MPDAADCAQCHAPSHIEAVAALDHHPFDHRSKGGAARKRAISTMWGEWRSLDQDVSRNRCPVAYPSARAASLTAEITSLSNCDAASPMRALVWLRDAAVILYEVSDVQPGTSMVLRDLLSDAAPVTVREKSATRTLKQWDRIAVRLVPERDHHVISGALLPFRAEAVDFLFAGLRDALKLKKREALRLSRDQLLGCAPIFTSAWLFIEIDRALTQAQPQLTNSDGDDLLFHDLRYPLASSVTQNAVAERLDRVKDFLPEGPRFWNWLAQRKTRGSKSGGGIMLDTQLESATVLGSLELKGKMLLVTVNSAERAAMVEALISAAAGGLLRSPLTTIRTADQIRADQWRDGPRNGADEIAPEIARRLMQEHLDKHYRETLDAPIPALGGKSPRQAVRSAAGRQKVIDWLKLLGNRSAKHDDGPIAEYDFSWMWVELGIVGHLM